MRVLVKLCEHVCEFVLVYECVSVCECVNV